MVINRLVCNGGGGGSELSRRSQSERWQGQVAQKSIYKFSGVEVLLKYRGIARGIAES